MIFSDSRLPHRRGRTFRKMNIGHRHHENVLSTRDTQYIFILILRVVTGLEGECEPHRQIKTLRGSVFREGADDLFYRSPAPYFLFRLSQRY